MFNKNQSYFLESRRIIEKYIWNGSITDDLKLLTSLPSPGKVAIGGSLTSSHCPSPRIISTRCISNYILCLFNSSFVFFCSLLFIFTCSHPRPLKDVLIKVSICRTATWNVLVIIRLCPKDAVTSMEKCKQQIVNIWKSKDIHFAATQVRASIFRPPKPDCRPINEIIMTIN